MSNGYGLWSLLPPVTAIIAAFWLKEPVIALFFGAWLGASMAAGGPVDGTLRLLDTHAIRAVADADHAAIILFTLLLGGAVGVMARSGGMRSVVDKISGFARTPRSGQLATWVMGLIIFFDDYANSLIVGQSMRPITDRLKISREKLAYIVDSTAAPVAAVAPISGWVGYEISLIASAYKDIGIEGDAYLIFLRTIPYSFYSLFALLFVFLVAWTGKDFGPMLAAERRAKKGRLFAKDAAPLAQAGELDGPKRPLRWHLGLLPVVVIIFAAVAGLFVGARLKAGPGVPVWKALGEVNTLHVLLWAAFAGSAAGVAASVLKRALSLKEAMEAWSQGVQSMMSALVILTLAWILGGVCKDLKTADAVVGLAGSFPAAWLPAGTFLIAGFVSFITGTSWGTMAILFPIVIPLAHRLPSIQGGPAEAILLASIASVLSGSVWGDHVSPISDTTILSSTGSSCDHLDHVRTQMPYALSVGAVAVLLGCLPAGYGLPPLAGLGLGAAALVFVVSRWGKRV